VGAEEPSALADRAADELRRRTGTERHDVAVVLGSGWVAAAEQLGEVVAEVPFAEVPGFPLVGTAGHRGVIRSIRSAPGVRVLAFLGRVHAYEGHRPAAVVHGVRSAVRAGCTTVVLTNAAGGLRPGMRVGQPVLVSDHLNLTGWSPLTGPPAPEPFGRPRFLDLVDAYAPRLRALARQVDPSLAEGVYACLPGPQYETPAEVRMLQTLGADLVGMSTVHEAIAARHLGAEILALSLVTNLAAGLAAGRLEHADVVEAGERAADSTGPLLGEVVRRI
jgi:purine-nucleoside phosphorylase